CIDDPVVRDILPGISRPILTYGFSEDADFRIELMEQKGMISRFRVLRPGSVEPLEANINLPGVHNVLNATAAIAVATEEGVSDEAIRQGLAGFQGVGRRFAVHGQLACRRGAVTLVDDYGHHPTEVAATIRA